MPHDKFGRLLEVGDKVTMLFDVTSVDSNPDNAHCNVTLQSVDVMPGNKTVTQVCAVNTRQTVLYEKKDGSPIA